MLLEIIIFCFLLISQLTIGTICWNLRRKLPQKYKHVLTNLAEPAKTLEVYSRVYRQVNLRVNANIDQPAYAEDNFLLLHRESMYLPYLYHNYFVIFQLEMTKSEHKFTRELFKYQSILFTLQLVLFLFALGFSGDIGRILLILGILIQCLLFIIAVLGFYGYEYILESVHEVAKDLLDLDDLDEARASGLKEDLKYAVFEYPIEYLWRMVGIFR